MCWGWAWCDLIFIPMTGARLFISYLTPTPSSVPQSGRTNNYLACIPKLDSLIQAEAALPWCHKCIEDTEHPAEEACIDKQAERSQKAKYQPQFCQHWAGEQIWKHCNTPWRMDKLLEPCPCCVLPLETEFDNRWDWRSLYCAMEEIKVAVNKLKNKKTINWDKIFWDLSRGSSEILGKMSWLCIVYERKSIFSVPVIFFKIYNGKEEAYRNA